MKTPSVQATEYAVRPPWPDELPRLAVAFPSIPWHRPMHLRVLVTSEPHARLVGYGALIVTDRAANKALLLFEVRPRFLDVGATRLLGEMITTASTEGVGSLEAPPPAKPPHPAAAVLAEAGFRPGPGDGTLNYDLK